MSSSATTTQTQQMSSKGQSPSTNSAASACLRLQSDLRSIRIEPPEVREDERERSVSLFLFFSPRTMTLPVRYFPNKPGLTPLLYTHTHRFLTNALLFLLHVFALSHRDVRHRRTRTITCSCGRRRFADRKIRPGKAASSHFG